MKRRREANECTHKHENIAIEYKKNLHLYIRWGFFHIFFVDYLQSRFEIFKYFMHRLGEICILFILLASSQLRIMLVSSQK